MTKLIRTDVEKPDNRGIQQAISILKNDGVVIFPTDSVYTMGARIYSDKGFKKLCQIKDIPLKKAQFSIICSDFSHLSEFSKQVDNKQFKLMKKYLPGPFTFILDGNKITTKIFHHNKKTVGFRIPNSNLIHSIVTNLGEPVFSASIQLENDSPYATSADEIYEEYEGVADMIIDGGICGEIPTTIVDLTISPYEILRQGAGYISEEELF